MRQHVTFKIMLLITSNTFYALGFLPYSYSDWRFIPFPYYEAKMAELLDKLYILFSVEQTTKIPFALCGPLESFTCVFNVFYACRRWAVFFFSKPRNYTLCTPISWGYRFIEKLLLQNFLKLSCTFLHFMLCYWSPVNFRKL